jgi:hypothetical protein
MISWDLGSSETVGWWFELVRGFQKLCASCSSCLFSEECSRKAFAKCSAKACDFSMLLLAQVPCDVLIGGEGFLTCFIFLVAFHRE